MLMFNFGLLKAVGRLGGQHLREECHTLRVKELQNALPWNMIGKLADIHIRLLYRHPWQKKQKTKKKQMKNKKYITIGTIPKSNIKIVPIEK